MLDIRTSCWFDSGMNAYLKDGRLADVLALIQVLAREKWAKRTEEGIVGTLQRKPHSASTWIAVSLEHAELFRVLDPEDSTASEPKTALITRLLQPKLPPEKPEEATRLEPLTLAETSKLLDLAVTLHDRAIQRKDRWKTVGISAISASAVVIAAILAFMKPASPPPAITVNPQIIVPEQKALPAPVQEQPKALLAPKESGEGK